MKSNGSLVVPNLTVQLSQGSRRQSTTPNKVPGFHGVQPGQGLAYSAHHYSVASAEIFDGENICLLSRVSFTELSL